MPFAFLAVLLLIAVNVRTVTRFRHDKRQAIAGGRRVPEVNLLGLAMIGGTPGAFLARRIYRHKTRKQPFSTMLWLIAMMQTGVAIGFTVPLPG